VPARLRIGWLADQRLPWSQLLGYVEEVERAGYDSVWLSDHLADEDGRWLQDPWTTLGALLARVPRVEMGTLVAANGLRAPLLTAQMARTLDDIGSARFVLGLGAGGSRSEHRWCHVAFPDLDQRVAELHDACQLLARSIGRDSPFPHVAGSPRRSPVPLLIGGTSRAILQIAARCADRWTVWGDPDELRSHGAVLSELAVSAGRRPADIRRGAIAMLLPDHLPERGDPAAWPAVLSGDELAIVGQLDRYAAAGVTDLVVCDYGLRPADRSDGLNWFARVASAFRSGRTL
jgi:alkanesulfonate monooxygenase SsuD/methylene tetrahydromethanopterin reductase-like flavin-dependent oxidoreductase (luciferase family)